MTNNEKIAHDLAVAVAAAKLSKSNNPQADIEVINDYQKAKNKFLSLLNQLN
ncbi:MAG: hypothetical protein K5983_04965 [Lactobacillus sp.]|nr:hypothetical protein [Lactobacillus sp.]